MQARCLIAKRPSAAEQPKKSQEGDGSWSAPLPLDKFRQRIFPGSFQGGLLLELVGAQVAQGGVQASGVVDLLDETRQVGGDVLERGVVGDVDRLDP